MSKSSLINVLLLLWILAEITGFILVGNWLGIGWTLLLIIATSALGLSLMRNHGFQMLQKFAERARQQERPEPSDMMEGSFIFIGGIFLIIPGFISDFVGLLCFIPPIRQALVRWLILAMSVPAPRKTTQRPLDDHSNHSGT